MVPYLSIHPQQPRRQLQRHKRLLHFRLLRAPREWRKVAESGGKVAESWRRVAESGGVSGGVSGGEWSSEFCDCRVEAFYVEAFLQAENSSLHHISTQDLGSYLILPAG